MRGRVIAFGLLTCVFCGFGMLAINWHMDYVRGRVRSQWNQAYQAMSRGDYGAIQADWIKAGRRTDDVRKLDARYGRPEAWRILRVYVSLGGGYYGGEGRVRRRLVDSVEVFFVGGIRGIDPLLGKARLWGVRVPPPHAIATEPEAIAAARPVIHQLDWDLNIRKLSATRIGAEWRVEIVGAKAGGPQTRYLILDAKDGQPVEHVYARIEDYPPEVLRMVLPKN